MTSKLSKSALQTGHEAFSKTKGKFYQHIWYYQLHAAVSCNNSIDPNLK